MLQLLFFVKFVVARLLTRPLLCVDKVVDVTVMQFFLGLVHFLDKVVDMPVIVQRQCWAYRAENCGGSAVAALWVCSVLGQVADVPVIVQRRGADRGVPCHRSWSLSGS